MKVVNISRNKLTLFFAFIATTVDLREIAKMLQENNAKIVKLNIFGLVHSFPEMMSVIQKEFGQIQRPISYIEGEDYFTIDFAWI